MGTTAQKLQNILDSKADIADAIEEKGGTLPAKLSDYGDAIRALPSGSVDPEDADVRFIDYDGTLLRGYTAAQVADLTAMPTPPDHTSDGLSNDSQPWNYDLNQLKAQVAATGYATVGAMYHATDGITRFRYWLSSSADTAISLKFQTTVQLGTRIDYGDGFAEDINSTSEGIRLHTYCTADTASFDTSVAYTAGQACEYNGSYYVFKYGGKAAGPWDASTVVQVNPVAIPSMVEITLNVTSGSISFSGPGATARYDNRLRQVILGNNVVEIRGSTFYGFTGLEKIAIPVGTSMLATSFKNCYGLKGVVYPTGTIQTGKGAFTRCFGIKHISLPPTVTHMEGGLTSGNAAEGTFQECPALKRVDLPKDLTEIGPGVFVNSGIEKVTGGGSLTTLGASAFMGATRLDNVSFPAATSIAKKAFMNCESLSSWPLTSSAAINTANSTSVFEGCSTMKEVDLSGYSFTGLPAGFFRACGCLKVVRLPDITSIGDNAFGQPATQANNNPGCVALYILDLSNCTSVPTLSSSALTGTSNSMKIVVADSMVSSFKNNTNWSAYSDRIIGKSEESQWL